MSERTALLGHQSGTWHRLSNVQEVFSSVFRGTNRDAAKGDDEAPTSPSGSLRSDSSKDGNQLSLWPGNFVLNGLLCVSLVVISVYEIIIKEKAVSRQAAAAKPFNMTSLIIWNSVLSIVIGVVVATYKGEMMLLFNSNTLRILARTMPLGCAFSFAAYLQFVILLYLPSDLFKVLEQSRLIVTALISFLILGKRQARISWIMLVIVTFASATYGVVRMSTPMAERHHDLLLFAQDLMGQNGYNVTQPGEDGLDAALFPSKFLGCVGKECRHSRLPNQTALAALLTGRRSMRSVKQLLAKEELAEEIGKYVRETHSESARQPHLEGLVLTLVYVFIMCGASVYMEKVLKDTEYLPFYIQKVFLEVPGLLFALFNVQLISPWLASKGIGQFSPTEAFFLDPFGGWDSLLVMLSFFFLVLKSWSSGLCVKVLSALTKQVCGVLGVALTYFFMLMHKCQAPSYRSTDFFCPRGLLDLSWEVTMADFLVFVTVATYVLLQIDHGEDTSYEKGNKG